MATRKDRIKAVTDGLSGNMKAINDIIPKGKIWFTTTFGQDLYYNERLDLVLTFKELETFKKDNPRLSIEIKRRTVITAANAHQFINSK